jgi:hypothetical protein
VLLDYPEEKHGLNLKKTGRKNVFSHGLKHRDSDSFSGSSSFIWTLDWSLAELATLPQTFRLRSPRPSGSQWRTLKKIVCALVFVKGFIKEKVIVCYVQ